MAESADSCSAASLGLGAVIVVVVVAVIVVVLDAFVAMLVLVCNTLVPTGFN